MKPLQPGDGPAFGDDAYAMEELVVKLGTVFLCTDLGFSAQPQPDHPAYLDRWLKVLKADKKAIFTAVSKASQAADHLTAVPPWAKARGGGQVGI